MDTFDVNNRVDFEAMQIEVSSAFSAFCQEMRANLEHFQNVLEPIFDNDALSEESPEVRRLYRLLFMGRKAIRDGLNVVQTVDDFIVLEQDQV